MQRCLSGLRSTTGNRVYVISVPWVQIPFSAPYNNNTNSETEFVLFFTRDFFGLIVRTKSPSKFCFFGNTGLKLPIKLVSYFTCINVLAAFQSCINYMLTIRIYIVIISIIIHSCWIIGPYYHHIHDHIAGTFLPPEYVSFRPHS